MQPQIRRVALAMFVLFAAVFVNLNYIQVLRASDYDEDPRNARQLIREYDIRRGSIVVEGRGEQPEVAHSVEQPGARLRFLRRYDEGPLYAHVTGFYSFLYGRSGLESAVNDFLVGSSPETFVRNLGDLLSGRERVGDDVITTLRPDVQTVARDAVGGRRGAVVALDPENGEILALWSSPSYDPNRLASHNAGEVREAWAELEADPARPRLNRAVNDWYPPGSTFKIVTAAAALANGITPEDTFDDPAGLELPLTTSTIGNFGGGTCNGGQPISLHRALVISCNTTFAQLGLDLGAAALVDQAERFGINAEWDFQLPLLASRMPEDLDAPATAQSAIGQRDVRVTPLQMAMILAAVGNDGILMTPQLVDRVEDFAGRIIRQYGPTPLRLPDRGSAQALTTEQAQTLTAMLVDVVASGTGRRAAIPGVEVAGKTGTAQHGDGPPTVWFAGFAPASDPEVAVAVVLEDGGGQGAAATGGAVAAPVARAVIEAALASAAPETTSEE